LFDTAFSITDITHYIRDLFQTDPQLADVWVTGEVSNFKRAASGHIYFTLKDSTAELSCALFRNDAQRQQFIPQSGDKIMAHGAIKVYAERGVYQLYCDRVRPVGVGDLYAQFERLKTALAAEGLFDEERKRPLPAFPRVIGVVTSADAAAFQDVQNVLRRRYPLALVLLAPTLVQGVEAPARIVSALAALNARPDVDVILVCRGGGSIEDLWAFNDERVARAIAASRVPIVSGVGHETDFTIADFAADRRAPTPSAAAEIITPDLEDLKIEISRARRALVGAMEAVIDDNARLLSERTRTLRNISPTRQIREWRQRLDNITARMSRAQSGQLAVMRAELRGKTGALKAASPQAILERGYTIVRRADDGTRIGSAQTAAAGDNILIQFHDGEKKATIR